MRSFVLSVIITACDVSADATQVTRERLLAHPTDAWLTNGGNLFNQRYSPLTDINRATVANLKGVWHVHLNGSGVGPPYSGEAQPIVHDGVMYVVTGADDVFAIEIASGKILWTYESGLDPAMSTICCGWTSRGVAVGEGLIYVGRLDSQLVALDQATGKERWRVQAARWEDGYTITSAPLYYDGMVITGFAGAEYGVRGRISAYRASDGDALWTFHTIPAPTEPGHDTWPADSDAWRRGGATVWQTPAVDPALGLLYFSTGNAGPDFNGSVRRGDNLYSVSMVALDAATGEYRWHFQQVHHDLWDYDAANAVVLFDVEIDGKPRHAIAQAGKTGWVYILDRITGKPLIGIEERPVPQEPRQFTSATQPYPVGDAFVPQSLTMPLFGVPPVNDGRIFTPYWREPVAAKPSSFGAAQWAPSSYDPNTHTMYICAMDLAGLFTGGKADGSQLPSQYLGGDFLFDRQRTGVFAAMDLRTNRLKWRQRWSDSCYSGSTVTAGGLVFTGLNDGRFIALDADDGRLLWAFQTGAGVNAPPAVFSHAGTQYVAIYAAGALFAQSAPGDSVWLFALSGTLDEVAPGKPPAVSLADTIGGAKAEDSNAAVAALFVRECGQCHGADGKGGHGGGPDLTGPRDRGTVAAVVAQGGETMPAFGSRLTYDQLQELAAYVSRGLRAER
jgi:quinohemoprotein ethanol dehydrogenase